MRETAFFPKVKRDVGLLHLDGFYLDESPRKVGGPEKVGQMCAVIMLNRLEAERKLREVGSYDLIPFVVSTLVDGVKELFENVGDNPDENLRDIKVKRIFLDVFTKDLEIDFDVYTQSGDYTALHFRIPYVESEGKLKVEVKPRWQ